MLAETFKWTRLKGDIQVMADTGENRQIIGRASAKEAETVRAAKKMLFEERSIAKASNAAFRGSGKGFDDVRKGANSGVSLPKLRRHEQSQHQLQHVALETYHPAPHELPSIRKEFGTASVQIEEKECT